MSFIFYYKQMQLSEPTEEDKKAGRQKHVDILVDCFNVTQVIRGRLFKDGSMLILLNDGHEEVFEVPPYDTKTGVKKTHVKERKFTQSEIGLSPEDATRFINFTSEDRAFWNVPEQQVESKDKEEPSEEKEPEKVKTETEKY